VIWKGACGVISQFVSSSYRCISIPTVDWFVLYVSTPRVVPQGASVLTNVAFEEMLEMGFRLGAKSCKFALGSNGDVNKVKLYVRSSFATIRRTLRLALL